MQRAIFISYRRDDSEGEAGRLYDDLIRVFGTNAVFMDVSDIHPGKDFRQAIDDNVAKSAVLLAIIGPGWTTIKDASGVRRLDQPNDFVRLEITSALTRGIDVIPVLVHGARMPKLDELPESLQNLAYRNCVELTHARWNSDVEVLSRALREYVQGGDIFATRSIHKAITGEHVVVETTPHHPDIESESTKPPRRLLRMAGAFLVLAAAAIAGAGAYVYIHHELKQHADQPISTSSASTTNSPTSATQQHLQALSGNWINPQAQDGKPVRVEIGAQGELASVHLWTRCGTTHCDLGAKPVALSGDGITIQWSGEFSNAGNEQMATQTVHIRIYRLGPGLHMIYSGTQTGSTGFDFVRSQ
jgi:hypothetical protein